MPENRARLFHISYPSGERRRFSNDLITAMSLEMTQNEQMLVVERTESAHIWIAPGGQAARQAITSGEHGAEMACCQSLPADSWCAAQQRPVPDECERQPMASVAPSGLRNYISMSSCGDR